MCRCMYDRMCIALHLRVSLMPGAFFLIAAHACAGAENAFLLPFPSSLGLHNLVFGHAADVQGWTIVFQI